MEFRLDDGQVELQRTVRRFAEERFPLDAVAAREHAPVDPAVWEGMAALGLFGLGDLGAVAAAIVFEQLGSHLAPGPVLWTVLAAGLVDGADAGAGVVGGVEAGAVEDGSVVVEHAGEIDVLLVLHGDRVVAHATADLGAPEPLVPLDPLTPVGRYSGLGAGTVVGDAEAAAGLRRRGTVLSAAALAGVAARALEVARAYALEREQFGVPIGSFQAVKHLLADMYVRAALAQSEAYAAAVLEDPTRPCAAAKLLAAEAAIANAGAAVQVLGGMGFTWDMLPHYLLKRAWVLEHGFGSADDLALDLGRSLAAARWTPAAPGR